jgi:hypothetical protein
MIEAWCFELSSVFPAKNCAPPCESCTMTGLDASFAALSAALVLCEPMTLTAGSAHCASTQYPNRSLSAEPDTTPGFSLS